MTQLVDAVQNNENMDAESSSAADSDHILLKRPNTIVLHATVADGLAERGVYTGAIAEQITNSYGNTSI